MKAVVLFSGGLDSTACLLTALECGHEVYPLTVLYGKAQHGELAAAARVLAALEGRKGLMPRKTITCMLPLKWGHMTGGADMREEDMWSSYVPARNGVLLMLAASVAQDVEAGKVYFGAVIDETSDAPCFPDTTLRFLHSAEETMRAATGSPIELVCPVVSMTKAQIIERCSILGLDPALTYSCWRGTDKPCGRCKACQTREAGFISAREESSLLARRRVLPSVLAWGSAPLRLPDRRKAQPTWTSFSASLTAALAAVAVAAWARRLFRVTRPRSPSRAALAAFGRPSRAVSVRLAAPSRRAAASARRSRRVRAARLVASSARRDYYPQPRLVPEGTTRAGKSPGRLRLAGAFACLVLSRKGRKAHD